MLLNDIFACINEGKFDAAAKMLNAGLEEAPDSPVFLGMQAYFELRRCNRPASVAAAQAAIDSKHWGNGTEAACLAILRTFMVPVLLRYSEKSLLNKAFEGVHRNHPNSKDLLELWYESMTSAAYPRGIHKALVANLKHDSEPRRAHFRLCYVMVQCYHEDDATKSEKSLFPMLANRMLSKFLPAIDAQECFVAAKVFEMTSVQKMTDYLSESSNEIHVAALLELQLLLLDGLQKTQQWERTWAFSQSQLNLIDSYNYWQALNEASVKLGRLEELKQFRSSTKWSGTSNWLLAAVDLAERLGEDKTGALAAYWTAMQNKRAASDLLLEYVKADTKLLETFESATSKSLNAKINLAKLRYAATGEADVKTLVNLYLSNKEQTDYMLASDALLIAAIETYQHAKSHNAMRAIILLEHAISKDPNHFQLRLWLVYLYRELGAMSKVEAHYEHLALKNIQLENLGYQLTTRAASTLPRKKAQKLLKKMVTNNNEVIGDIAREALNNGVFTQVKGMWDLHQRLQSSLGRAVVDLENAKESRLNNEAVDYEAINEITADLVDNRDFSTMYDPQGIKPWTKLVQGREWVSLNRDKELILCARSMNIDPAISVEDFSSRAAASKELLPVEKWSAEVVAQLARDPHQVKKLPFPPPPNNTNTELLNYGYTLVETQLIVQMFSGKKVKLDLLTEIKTLAKNATSAARKQGQQALVDIKPWAEDVGLTGSGSLVESIVKSLLDNIKDLDAVATSLLK